MFKKFSAFLMAVLMIMGTMSVFSAVSFAADEGTAGEGTDAEAPVCPGADLSGDGKFSIEDVTTILNLLATQTAENPSDIDFDNDGKLQIGDVTVLLNGLAGGYTGKHEYVNDVCKWCGAKAKYVIYHANSNTLMTGIPNSNKLEGVGVTYDETTGIYTAKTNDYVVLTKTVLENDNFVLQNEAGEYLTAGATGNSLTFTAEKTDYSEFAVDTEGATAGCIKAVNSSFGTNAQYIEYCNNHYTTYSVSGTDLTAYTFAFVNAEKVVAEHTHSYTEVTTEPTCTTAGKVTDVCSCGKEIVISTTDALGHNFVDGVCTRCGATETASCDHTYENFFCTKCGAFEEGDYIINSETSSMKATVASDRLGFVANAVSDTAPTLSADDLTIKWTISATSDGYYTLYNADAGVYAASTGAKNKAQLLTIADGETIPDTAKWKISVTDGKFEFVNIENENKNINKNLRCNGTYGFACYATSTGKSLTLYKYTVSTCEHEWTETVIPATCTTNGSKTTTCDKCGATTIVVIPATGHTYGEGVITTEATCTTHGVKTFTCTNCGEIKTEETPLAEHIYVDGVCSGCGATQGTAAAAQTVTMKYTGTTTNMKGDPANNAAAVGLDALLFTVTASKGNNSNFPGLNKDGTIRLYADTATNEGNSIAVAIASGYTITSVKITIAKGTLTLAVNGTDTAVKSDELMTVNATSFTLKNTSTAQAQITSVEITYEAVAQG